MKKKFKDRALVRVLGSLLKGAIKDIVSLPLAAGTGAIVAATEQIKTIKQENLEDKTGGIGKTNYVRYAGIAIGVILLAYLFGFIPEEKINFLLELFENYK